MDKAKFDGLARKISTERSRRDAFRIAGTGLVAGLVPGLFLAGEPEAAGLSSEACSPVGTKCGRRRNGRRRDGKRRRQQPACSKCCSRYTSRQRNGQRRCSCIPDLSLKTCLRDDQCCSGVCRKIEDLCDETDPDGCERPEDFPFPPGAKVCIPGYVDIVLAS